MAQNVMGRDTQLEGQALKHNPSRMDVQTLESERAEFSDTALLQGKGSLLRTVGPPPALMEPQSLHMDNGASSYPVGWSCGLTEVRHV